MMELCGSPAHAWLPVTICSSRDSVPDKKRREQQAEAKAEDKIKENTRPMTQRLS
jgi:hypothetical protein